MEFFNPMLVDVWLFEASLIWLSFAWLDFGLMLDFGQVAIFNPIELNVAI